MRTKTPLMAKKDLYVISDHWGHYKEGMFVLGDEEKEDIYLKAAVEGFRECYPPEQPKRIAAEQRMRERQGE